MSTNIPSYRELEEELQRVRKQRDDLASIVEAVQKIPSIKSLAFTHQDDYIADVLGGSFSQIFQSINGNKEVVASQKVLHDAVFNLMSIMRSAHAGVGISKNRKIFGVNKKCEEILGYTNDELMGRSTRMLYLSEKEFEAIGHEMHRQIVMFDTATIETRFRRKDGKILSILLKATPIDLNDHEKGMTFSALDISELKTKEVALLESEEKYRSMMEALTDPVFICSADRRITYVNPAMAQWLGQDGVVGRICNKAIFNLDKPCTWCCHDKVMAGRSVAFERDFPSSGGTYHVAHSPIHHTDGNISMLTIFRDISEVKSLTAMLQHSQKMESIGTFAGGIAHDFNNMLFPIMGHTEMLLSELAEDSPYRSSLNEIYTASNRAKELVRQILTFSRRTPGELKLMSMQMMVKEAIKFIRSSIPSIIEIKHHVSPHCRAINADPTQIHQVVMNLVTNAYHAMEQEGGVMTVTFKEVGRNDPDVREMESEHEAFASLTVSDTGVGISEENIQRIFEPFFTTKRAEKGTGMGLSVVHGIVKRAGGIVRVKSRLGQGSEFKVLLPIAKSDTEKEADQVKKMILGRNQRILIVDDDAPALSMEVQMLQRLGYHVTSRLNSMDALEAFKAAPDAFDLVITDMSMPNLPGDKFAMELKRIQPTIPILICTGFSEIISKERADAMGIDGFLTKPIVMSDLSQTIHDVLVAGREAPDPLSR